MQLSIYSTSHRKQVVFRPLDKKQIKMYVCGPTVYDHPHIGNARSIVIYDVLFRILRHIYGTEKVKYIRNITDIDDKIIERAKILGITNNELTVQTTADFHQDTKYLHCLSPSEEPKATDNIAEMIAIIAKLITKGVAYITKNNDVYFAVAKAKDYFALSNRNALQAQTSSRTKNNKANAEDFVLWKADVDGDCAFPSPWGSGRPGWHIECSAMSHRYLGENFDIHGGGADLIFPHHSNEIAQSMAAFPGSKFANYWVHNGFLTVNGEKMSKSTGNFITVKDLRDRGIYGEAVRLLLLATHYRKPLDYNEKALRDAEKMLRYWYKALADVGIVTAPRESKDFIAALTADLNTPLAIKKIHDLAKLIHATTEKDKKLIYAEELLACANFLGLLQSSLKIWLKGSEQFVDEATEIEQIILKRVQAKKNQDWQQADQLREEAKKLGALLIDKADGTTTWQKTADS